MTATIAEQARKRIAVLSYSIAGQLSDAAAGPPCDLRQVEREISELEGEVHVLRGLMFSIRDERRLASGMRAQ